MAEVQTMEIEDVPVRTSGDVASDTWQTGIREGYRTKIIRVGNCTVAIHRPILSPEEQKAAEERVKRELMAILGGV